VAIYLVMSGRSTVRGASITGVARRAAVLPDPYRVVVFLGNGPNDLSPRECLWAIACIDCSSLVRYASVP
jgi:hypothetical protein